MTGGLCRVHSHVMSPGLGESPADENDRQQVTQNARLFAVAGCVCWAFWQALAAVAYLTASLFVSAPSALASASVPWLVSLFAAGGVVIYAARLRPVLGWWVSVAVVPPVVTVGEVAAFVVSM